LRWRAPVDSCRFPKQPRDQERRSRRAERGEVVQRPRQTLAKNALRLQRERYRNAPRHGVGREEKRKA
jgi:hypothetical protein